MMHFRPGLSALGLALFVCNSVPAVPFKQSSSLDELTATDFYRGWR
jgi:hypothetical protein